MIEKDKKIIINFLNSLDVEGICDYWIDDEVEVGENIWVYIVIDIDWITEIETKPGFVSSRMRLGIREEIKKWMGLDVNVGSIAKKCNTK